jgi:beta-lactamase regulating signal transducer with metallopeptidase domain
MTDAIFAAFAIVIKTTVLLLCVSVASVALRRASASVRHALWVVGLLAVLVFPVSRILPEWDWAILPEAPPPRTAFDTTPAPLPTLETVRIPSSPSSDLSNFSAGVSPVFQSHSHSASKWTWQHWIGVLWVFGSSVLVVGWLKSIWDLQRLTRRSTPLSERGWADCLAEVRRDIGVKGPVELRVVPDAIPPMAWGIFHHVILMPAAAIDWPLARQRLVLAHEMAHVKRNDGAGQLLTQAVCILYWFNPLVWYAVYRLRVERERACDDCVLRLGAEGADYADHLLQIARGLNAGFAKSAVSMAEPSQLRARMIAILDSRMKRSRASRITATVLITTFGVLTLSMAAVQVTALSTMALPAFAKPLGVPMWRLEPAEVQRPTPTPQQPSAVTLTAQQEFIGRYCAGCHNVDDRVGGLILLTANANRPANNRFSGTEHFADITHVTDNTQEWEKILRRLRSGMDPPPFSPTGRPTAPVIQSVIQFLEEELDRNAKTYVPPIGPHRLNRTEYANAVRDLLDLEIDSTKLLPPDDSTHGFDNIVDALGSTAKAADAYVGVAPIVSRMAIQTPITSSSYQKVFICKEPEFNRGDAACAQKIITVLVENAFRGSVTTEEIQSFISPGNGAHAFEIEAVLARILASPKFLFRTEEAPANAKPGEAYRISDLALASRLSFFLWSTGPDQELIDLAKQGKLHEPLVLEQQALRMLKDYRADSLSTNFAGQWLGLRSMQNVSPSPALFSEFDESIRQAMRRESELLFDSIVREDRNVVDLLTADYTFVNNRLAHFYGIPNVTGSQFRRVTLGDAFDLRRGILGKAALLTVTSFSNRTSPTTRGKWIMNSLLGTSPPDPPPNVLPLKERDALEHGMRVTLEAAYREQGAQHGDACVKCHRLVDPIGYSLENFNPIGLWRDAEGGSPIDAADTMFDGTAVNGPADMRRWLVAHSDQFVQTLTVKLMTYALGRGVEAQDMPLIRAIDREVARNSNRFSSIVLGIVKSDTFQMNSK